MEALATTQSQGVAPKDVPRRTSLNLDLQHGEGNRQARLQVSFTLEEMVPTTSMVYPSRAEASLSRPAQGGTHSTKVSGMVQKAHP